MKGQTQTTIPTCSKCGFPKPIHKMMFNGWLCEDCFELWKKVHGERFLGYEKAVKIWEKFIRENGQLFVFR